MVYMSFVNDDAAIASVFEHRPDRYSHFLKIVDNVLQGPSDIGLGERELIATYVSGLNQCQYCFGSHGAFAEAQGVDPALFDLLLEDIDSAPIDDNLKPIFHYAKKLTLTPHKLTDSDANSVFNASWSEQALSDVVAICCVFAFANRLVDGHGISGQSFDAYRDTAKIIKQNGYDASS